jgi:hypothetical protein
MAGTVSPDHVGRIGETTGHVAGDPPVARVRAGSGEVRRRADRRDVD